jgi:broad specificity phosphatase PhoE
MVTSHSPATPGTPAQIYVIRHGEKPANPPTGKHAQSPNSPFGVDVDGNQNAHSLLPRGWQRSGALAALFDPAVGALQAGLRTPTALYSPSYTDPDKTQNHRTYQTIQALSERLDVFIQSPVPEGQEPALAAAVLASGGEVVLICWEHQHIPALAQAIPALDATTIPSAWPGDRFDVIWTFTLDPATGRYVFGQVPQQLLLGDTDTVISDDDTGKVS